MNRGRPGLGMGGMCIPQFEANRKARASQYALALGWSQNSWNACSRPCICPTSLVLNECFRTHLRLVLNALMPRLHLISNAFTPHFERV